MRSTLSWMFVVAIIGTFGWALLIVGLAVSQAINVFAYETFNAGLAIIGFSTLVNFVLGIRVFIISNIALEKRKFRALARGELFAVVTSLCGITFLGSLFTTAIIAYVGRISNKLGLPTAA